MLSYSVYKVLHILGILGVFTGLGALVMHSCHGGEKGFKGTKMVKWTIYLSLVIVFVAGFGLMARLNMMGAGWPLWIHLKVAIWVALGGAVALIGRKTQWAAGLFYAVIAVGGIAAWVANYKPL